MFVACLAVESAAVRRLYAPPTGAAGSIDLARLQALERASGPLLSLHQPVRQLESSCSRKADACIRESALIFNWRCLGPARTTEHSRPCAGRLLHITARPPPLSS
jgi:hypothetical protein